MDLIKIGLTILPITCDNTKLGCYIELAPEDAATSETDLKRACLSQLMNLMLSTLNFVEPTDAFSAASRLFQS